MKPQLVEPDHTAVLTMEMQRGVVGDLSAIDSLADAVVAGRTIEHAARLAAAARGVGARVVHCTAEFRPDLAGTAINSPLIAVMARRPDHMRIGTPSTEIVPEITAAVDTSFATVNRSRAGAMYTPVVSSRFVVTAARADIRHQGSGQSVSGDQTGDPSSWGEYVYRDRRSRG